MKSLKQVRAYFTLLGVTFGAVALLAGAPLAADAAAASTGGE